MYKVIWMLKRKPGISFEQFRDHYETSHAELGKKHFGYLMISYQRNYDLSNQSPDGTGPFGLPASGYDCLGEWIMRDEAAFQECLQILANPEVSREFEEDEERFLDRPATRLIICDCRDTGTARQA